MTTKSDDKAENNDGADVVPLPVPPAWNGMPMTTVRVPVRVVEMLKQMKPNVEFAMAVTLLLEESFEWAAKLQAYTLATNENGYLKQRLAELVLERWEREAKAKVMPSVPAGVIVQ